MLNINILIYLMFLISSAKNNNIIFIAIYKSRNLKIERKLFRHSINIANHQFS